MAYHLAVDIGNTRTKTAVARDGRVEVAGVMAAQTGIPSVVFHDGDGPVAVGDAAVERGRADPGRVATAVMERIGDPTPVVLGGVMLSPSYLVAAILRAVIDAVQEREGGPPESVALAHPASW